MSDHEEQDALLEEAAMLFLELSENPENGELLAERARFIDRSSEARKAYLKVEQGWRVSGGRPRSQLSVLVPFALALGAGLYAMVDPLRTYLMADVSTGTQAVQSLLTSGDLAHLDAGSAIADDTEGDIRHVSLLQGSAFFDVATNGQPFVVSVDAAEVTVRGTAFETSYLADGVSVSVAEGRVDVTIDDKTWALAAGSELVWQKGSGISERPIEEANVASWRNDQLVADNLSIRQVADILDRRIRGQVIVLGGSWADGRVSGTFDLADPQAALEALAVISKAKLHGAVPFALILRPRE